MSIFYLSMHAFDFRFVPSQSAFFPLDFLLWQPLESSSFNRRDSFTTSINAKMKECHLELKSGIAQEF